MKDTQKTSRRLFLRGSTLVGAQTLLYPAALKGFQALSAEVRDDDQSLLEELVTANHVLANEGVVDAYGHVSARLAGDRSRYLLSRSVAAELVTASDFIKYDLDSSPLDAGGRAQFLERFIHGEIYQSRPDVNAIVHSHSPAVIPFGVSTVPLQPVYHMAAFIGQGVPVFDIRTVAGMSDMIVRSAPLGHALALILGDKPALLMRGHGAVVVGASLRQAVGRSIYLQLNAQLQMQAIALGGKVEYLSPEEARKSGAPDDYERAWELWKRKAQGR